MPIGGAQDYRESENRERASSTSRLPACARNTLALELIERCLAQVDRFMSLGRELRASSRKARPRPTCRSSTRLRARDAAARARGWKQHLDCGSRLMKDALLRGQLAGVGIG